MKKDTEQIILDTARKHFLKNGFSATRMQEIADEAGINKAMLHYYFRTKEKLYQEIIRRTLSSVIPKFIAAIDIEGTFWERVEHLVDTHINMIFQNPDIPIFIMSELSQKKESFITELQKHTVNFKGIQSFIQQMLIEMGEGKIKQMPPEHLFLNILGMTAFPFMTKPIFSTVFSVSEQDFDKLMRERKTIIMEFLKNALRVD